MTDAAIRRRYFAALLAVQAAIYGWLLLSHRIPRGHDTLSVFLLQYVFLAQPGSGAGVALWIPQLAHGMTSAWFANVQTGLLQNALLLFGGVPEGTPMLPVYYAGLFLEDLVLLVGVWRLGARFYRSPAAQFFVAAAAVGSSMWAGNIFWSHRLIYGLPMLLSLLLDVLETGSRPRLLLAASFGSLLLLGNAVYIPVMSGLSVAFFLGLHILLHRKRLQANLPLFRPRATDLLWFSAILLVVAAAVTAVLADLGSMRQYQRGRNPDGSVTLETFLTYPGGMNPLRYIDLALGLNVSTDFSLYAGLCTLILAVRAFFRRPRKDVLALGISLLVLLLFSMGYLSWVGMAAYEAIPPLRYFRYVGLTCALVKLFLILLSGFGFEALVRADRHAVQDGRGRSLEVGMAFGGLLFAQLLYRILRGPECPDGITFFLKRIMGDIVERMPQGSAGSGLTIELLCAGMMLLIAVWRRRRQAFPLLVPLLLFVHGIDLIGWRTLVLREETLALDPPLVADLDIRPIPYALRRTPSEEGNPRALGFGRQILKAGSPSSGMLYDYCDPFLHREPSWSSYFVTQWSPPVDLLLRAHAGRPLAFDRDPPPPFAPGDPPAYARLIGEREDKLQVFSAAHPARTDEEIAGILHRPDFRGDTLYLSAESPDAPTVLDPELAARTERLPATTRVVDFRPDRIRIEVDVPTGRDDAWLVYGDAWHPGWKATVDGAPRPVRRANLAYKAVALHGGRNVVEFRFQAPLRAACYGLLGLQCVAWTLGLAAWSLHELGIGRLRGAARSP